MTMHLDPAEVQVAVVEYLRKRGAIVESVEQVQLVNFSKNAGGYVNIVGVTPTVAIVDVVLPESPYR